MKFQGRDEGLAEPTEIDPARVAEALLTSAGWARIGLTAPSAYLREQAAKELALSICEKLNPAEAPDRDQLAFPL